MRHGSEAPHSSEPIDPADAAAKMGGSRISRMKWPRWRLLIQFPTSRRQRTRRLMLKRRGLMTALANYCDVNKAPSGVVSLTAARANERA